MAPVTPLARSYAEARAAFVTAADAAGAQRTSFPHPLRGPEGEELAIDVAELGPSDATRVVVVVSATHGVEGYTGSALQTQWLTHHADERPGAVRVVLVHGLNPYGFAWVRRVNEDNVDLNRNFIDWSEPAPLNADYATIAALLVPERWTPDEVQRTTGEILTIAADWGFPKLQAVVSGGQYQHRTGVFYGGAGPVWSHRWLREWSAAALAASQTVRILDLHTGLGPNGVGELISHASSSEPPYQRATALWGPVMSMVDGDSVSAPLQGDWLAASESLAPHAEVTAVAVEYGTVDTVTVLQALRADAWLHANGDPVGPDAAAVRAQVRAAFADDDPTWIERCWQRFHPLLTAAMG